MTDDDIRRIIHRIVVSGSGDDDVDDRMDLAIFRAGMEAAAKICGSMEVAMDTPFAAAQLVALHQAARDIRAAANGRAA